MAAEFSSNTSNGTYITNTEKNEFNELMKDEFAWLDKLRDACVNDNSHWNVNLVYDCQFPDDTMKAVRARHEVPSLSDLRAELNDITNELQSLEANGMDDEEDEDSSSTEVSSLSSLDLSDKEYRARNDKLIDQLRSKKHQVVESMEVILNSKSPSGSNESPDSASCKPIDLPSDVVSSAANLVTAVDCVKKITQDLKDLPLDD